MARATRARGVRESLSPSRRLAALALPLLLAGACSRAHPAAAPAPVAPAPAAAPVAAAGPAPVVTGTAFETEIPLEEQGGTFVVPVSINDTIVLKFTLDSGAADVSLPADVVSTLVRTGTLTRDDYIGDQTFVMADGTQVPSAEFRIRTLKVGTLVLHDVTGSLSEAKGSLLLGQSFLSRLSNWSIDNSRQVLVLKAAPGAAERQADSVRLPDSDRELAQLLDTADVQRLADQFGQAFKAEGMSGVASLVEGCYAGLQAGDRRGAAYCVTLDLVGRDIDAGFRRVIQQRYGKSGPPAPFYEDAAWRPRLQQGLLRTTRDGQAPSAAVFEAVAKSAEQRLVEAQSAPANSGS